MAKKVFLQLIFLLLSTAVLAQATYDEKLKSLYKNTVPQVRAVEVKEKIKSNQKIILLDTRSPEEYNVSHIPGATFIEYDKFKTADVEQLDHNAEIILYCTVGYRSERIGEKLMDMGFTNVKNLYGGIFQWANEEGPLKNKKNQSTDSVHTYSRRWSVWLKNGVKVY